MKPIILYRHIQPGSEEIDIAAKYFPVSQHRNNIPNNSLVIGRYSVLPFYSELEQDLEHSCSKLINNYHQHLYVADVMRWYEDIKDFTPETWNEPYKVPDDVFPVVLKGATNSHKHLWDTHMFASNRKEMMDVYCRLLDDSLIGRQNIYIRRFIPLNTYCISLHGLPITQEYRYFIYNQKILSGGYYWSSHLEEVEEKAGLQAFNTDQGQREFLKTNIIPRIGNQISFYAIDVAMTETGAWIVIELNDGQQSGTSENTFEELYGNLKKELTNG